MSIAKRKIYLSGPISGHDIDERRKEFKKIQNAFEKEGHEVVNPMENGLPEDATTNQHMKRDIELLLTCDSIYMMKKWTHSAGCITEFHVAHAIGLEIMFEQEIDNGIVRFV